MVRHVEPRLNAALQQQQQDLYLPDLPLEHQLFSLQLKDLE